jgi:hypothetical protein
MRFKQIERLFVHRAHFFVRQDAFCPKQPNQRSKYRGRGKITGSNRVYTGIAFQAFASGLTTRMLPGSIWASK